MRTTYASFIMTTALGCLSSASADPTQHRSGWSGVYQLSSTATVSYESIYPSRHFHPTLRLELTPSSNGRVRVKISDSQYQTPYTCQLSSRVDQSRQALVIDAGQRCELTIGTSDFCTLARDRCSSRLRQLTCANEKQEHHEAPLVARVLNGVVSRSGHAYELHMDLSVDACVLAEGYQANSPIWIEGGSVAVHPASL